MTQSQSFEEIANDWVGRRQRIATEFRISIKDVDYWAEVVEREGKGTWPPIEPGVLERYGWVPEKVDWFIRRLLIVSR
jgi:hypothetical protein